MFDAGRLWDAIYGNESLKERFRYDIEGNRLSHAYILEGPEHSGKMTLTRTVAATLCGDEINANKIFSGISPDIYELSVPENKKTIGIDTVREIKSTVYIKPNDLEFKFYIISHAESLTVQAQNALLKLIEEPPRNVYFWLHCENVTALLPTIRSRAPIVRMQLFSADELKEMLLKNSREAERLERRDPELLMTVARSSKGSYGEALLKLQKESEGASYIRDCLALLEATVGYNSSALLSVIYKLPTDREAFVKTMNKFRLLVRDILTYRVTDGECEYLFDDPSRVEEFSEKLSLGKLLAMDEILFKMERDLYVNPNIQNLKTQLYVKLCKI